MIKNIMQTFFNHPSSPSTNTTPTSNDTSSESGISEDDDPSIPDSQEQDDDAFADDEDQNSAISEAPALNTRPRRERAAKALPETRTPARRLAPAARDTRTQRRGVLQTKSLQASPATPIDSNDESDNVSVKKATGKSARRAPARTSAKGVTKKKSVARSTPPAQIAGSLLSLPFAPRSGRTSTGKDVRSEDAARYHPSLGNTPEAGSPPRSSSVQPAPASEAGRNMRPRDKVQYDRNAPIFKDLTELNDTEWDKMKSTWSPELVSVKEPMEIIEEGGSIEIESRKWKTQSNKRPFSELQEGDAAADPPSKIHNAGPPTPEEPEPPAKKERKLPLKLDLSKYARAVKQSKADPLAPADPEDPQTSRYYSSHKSALRKENRGKASENENLNNKLKRLHDQLPDLESDSWGPLVFRIKNQHKLTKEELEPFEKKREYAINKIKEVWEKNERFNARNREMKLLRGSQREKFLDTPHDSAVEDVDAHEDYIDSEIGDDYDFKEDTTNLKKPTSKKTFKRKESALRSIKYAAIKPDDTATTDPESWTRSGKRKADDLPEQIQPGQPAKSTMAAKSIKHPKIAKSPNNTKAIKPPAIRPTQQTNGPATTRATRSSARNNPEEPTAPEPAPTSNGPMTRNKRLKTET